jgi:hypothetical protein
MKPNDPVFDIMRRTMSNLKFIEGQATSKGPYEITQLLNSFLGAMAHPWENMKKELNGLSIDGLVERGWPEVCQDCPTDKRPKSLGDLIRLLRNGIAHGNIKYIGNDKGEIRAVRIENRNNGKRTWGTTLEINAMRQFLKCFVDLIEELDPKQR